eukprot:gene10179-34237_t
MAPHSPSLSSPRAAALRRAERRVGLRALLHQYARDAALRRARRRHLARSRRCADEDSTRSALIAEESAAWEEGVNVPGAAVRARDPWACPVGEYRRAYWELYRRAWWELVAERLPGGAAQRWVCGVRTAARLPLLVCAEHRLRTVCAAVEVEEWGRLCAKGVAWLMKAQRIAHAAVVEEESRQRADAQQRTPERFPGFGLDSLH